MEHDESGRPQLVIYEDGQDAQEEPLLISLVPHSGYFVAVRTTGR
jgi:hypothetical protein